MLGGPLIALLKTGFGWSNTGTTVHEKKPREKNGCCPTEACEKWVFSTASAPSLLRAKTRTTGFNAAPKYTVPGTTKPSVTYKWNFSSQTGFRFPKMVLVRFLVLPTCTVTYGSLDPVLSLACRPWAHTTATQIQMRRLQTMLPNSEVLHITTPPFSILEQPLPAPLHSNLTSLLTSPLVLGHQPGPQSLARESHLPPGALPDYFPYTGPYLL